MHRPKERGRLVLPLVWYPDPVGRGRQVVHGGSCGDLGGAIPGSRARRTAWGRVGDCLGQVQGRRGLAGAWPGRGDVGQGRGRPRQAEGPQHRVTCSAYERPHDPHRTETRAAQPRRKKAARGTERTGKKAGLPSRSCGRAGRGSQGHRRA